MVVTEIALMKLHYTALWVAKMYICWSTVNPTFLPTLLYKHFAGNFINTSHSLHNQSTQMKLNKAHIVGFNSRTARTSSLVRRLAASCAGPGYMKRGGSPQCCHSSPIATEPSMT